MYNLFYNYIYTSFDLQYRISKCTIYENVCRQTAIYFPSFKVALQIYAHGRNRQRAVFLHAQSHPLVGESPVDEVVLSHPRGFPGPRRGPSGRHCIYMPLYYDAVAENCNESARTHAKAAAAGVVSAPPHMCAQEGTSIVVVCAQPEKVIGKISYKFLLRSALAVVRAFCRAILRI